MSKLLNKNSGPVLSKSNGFTLIEVMIAITLFTAIMILGTGAVLQTSAVHKKTQSMRSIMDNLNFVMEDMARNLRLGYNYQCPVGDLPILAPVAVSDCSGENNIAFEGADGSVLIYGISANPQNNSLFYVTKSKDGGNTFVPVTPEEVLIDPVKSGFTVIGSAPDTIQPRVIIRLAGTVLLKNISTEFDLQTTVSQRLLDI